MTNITPISKETEPSPYITDAVAIAEANGGHTDFVAMNTDAKPTEAAKTPNYLRRRLVAGGLAIAAVAATAALVVHEGGNQMARDNAAHVEEAHQNTLKREEMGLKNITITSAKPPQ